MIISRSENAKQYGQFIENKNGYVINGQFYNKDLTPIPLDFRLIESCKNLFFTKSIFPIIRHAGDNVYSNETSCIIEDEYDSNIYYIVTQSPSNIETNSTYDGVITTHSIFKIYENGNNFKILASKVLNTGSTNTYPSTFKYQSQDESYLYGIYVTNSGYNGTVSHNKISKSDLVVTSGVNNYFSEILYEDNTMMISFANPNSITTPYTYKVDKITMNIYGYSNPLKDPEEDSQYVFTNDGTGEDPNKNKSNYKTIHNVFYNFTTRKEIKKFNGIFSNNVNNNVDIYRVIIGSDDILEDGKVNIVKFNADIDALKVASSSIPQLVVKTCKVTNKENETFKLWKNKMHTLNSYYFTCKTMKFENEENLYLVIDTFISASLAPIFSSTDSRYVNSNIAVFKIDKSDYSSLTFVSEYVENGVAHKSLSPLNDDLFLLSTDNGWCILSFNYNDGTFTKIKDIKKGTGYLGLTSDNILVKHDHKGNLDYIKLTEVPYKASLSHENSIIKWQGEELETNLTLVTKDFLGNNTDCIVDCSIIGDNVVFRDNSSTEITVSMTKSDDKKEIPIKITGPSTVEFSAVTRHK